MFGYPLPRLTVFGRSVLLICIEVLANVLLWIVTALLFARKQETRDVMNLALLAWTLGLRHGLDADHISAIDNATRGLISLGQLPVTCGLFFSLGHSTIVVIVIIAIAISTNIYDKIGDVSKVGGIIGAAVSGSFLFLIGLANSIILWGILKERRLRRKREVDNEVRMAQGHSPVRGLEDEIDDSHNKSLSMRILGPVTRFVDRPWKMYPVGVLFGFGFDTASSIALLAVTAIAKRDSSGHESIHQADIVILPFLFTAGMTFVDSADSVLMLYSYAGPTESGLSLFESNGDRVRVRESSQQSQSDTEPPQQPHASGSIQRISTGDSRQPSLSSSDKRAIEAEASVERRLRVKKNTMSSLSIVLTLVSILVAFSISLITIMGLIGENCRPCQEAANAEDGGGLSGRWWRGWTNANEQSGFIGAAIVGGFVAVVAIYYGLRYIRRRRSRLVSL